MGIGRANLDVPLIDPVPNGVDRPFWSVMIPTYNCADYLVHTLKSVLAQDPGPEFMQIEVVDDCSTKDDPEAVVKALGQGRVHFHRRPQNGGAIANFNTCLQRSIGQWVHVLHGDDMVVPGFYQAMQAASDAAPDLGAAFCRSIVVDEEGTWQSLSALENPKAGILVNWMEKMAVSQRINTPAIVVKRSVYEALGGFHMDLFHAADWEMWKRISAFFPVWYEPRPLAYYRVHSSSDTSRLMRTAANIANIRLAVEITRTYLPVDRASALSTQSLSNWGYAAINLAHVFAHHQDLEASLAQAWEGICCSADSRVLDYLKDLILQQPEPESFLQALEEKSKQGSANETSRAALQYLHRAIQPVPVAETPHPAPTVIVDGVFFQLFKTGIARVWRSLLQEWAKSGFADQVIVLSRANTAPQIPGIRYRSIPAYDYHHTEADRAMLQQVCDEEGADVFISSYYTTPLTTPSVFMGYDMTPEVLGGDLNEPMWQEKHHGIRHGSAYICISENTASDLLQYFPAIDPTTVTVAHCGVSEVFKVASPETVQAFRSKYGIHRPYFLLVGPGMGYKNTILFFRAFAQLASCQGFDLVCSSNVSYFPDEFRPYTKDCTVYSLSLSDEELSVAYSGAIALVYPSLYEGFGMPVAEALASGCPVITCYNSSIPEVAGEAALYVDPEDVEGMVEALCEVQKPRIRQKLIETGLQQVQKFSWTTMAQQVSQTLIQTTLLPLNLRDINLIAFPDWSKPEEELGAELADMIAAIVRHPQQNQITLMLDARDTSAENANLLLSSVTMHLMMAEDLEIGEGPSISLIPALSPLQWKALLPQIQARVPLTYENSDAIDATGAATLVIWTGE